MKRFIIVFISVSVVVYVFSAIILNIIAYNEYRNNYWPIVSAYSPFFLFQITFLPIILVAMLRPMQDYKSFLVSELPSPGIKSKAISLWPVIMTLILTFTACYTEFTQPQIAIWEISPETKNATEVERFNETGVFNKYMENNDSQWQRSSSWPNIFHYLEDIQDFVKNSSFSSLGEKERNDLTDQQENDKKKYTAFLKLENITSDKVDVSRTRIWYQISFTLLILLASMTLCFIVFFAGTHAAGKNYRQSLLSLSIAILGWFFWLPMRAANASIKESL